MSNEDVNGVDRMIPYVLQGNARNMSSGDIAKRTGTSDSTVRKRIQRLEPEGMVRGYSAGVDYQKSGYPLRVSLYCTTSIPKRDELVPEILKMGGVMAAQESITSEQSLLVTAVCEADGDITVIAQELLDIGVIVADEVLIRTHETTPLGEFDTKKHVENDF